MKKILKSLIVGLLVFLYTDNVFAFTCKAITEVEIDNQLAHIIRYVILILQILVPIILIIMGIVDFARSITAQKEEDIKRGKQVFIKRVIAGIFVFFVIAIVKFVVSAVAGGSDSTVINCANCFLKGPDDANCS